MAHLPAPTSLSVPLFLAYRPGDSGQGKSYVQRYRPGRFSHIAVAVISLGRNERSEMFGHDFWRRQLAHIDIIGDRRHKGRAH